ncbi:DUF3727 domain-containing protein [Crocosphaera watsonii WH 8501]|uniref:DUF3727 domain-containing protein n=2 Tax=Crocosphaera watsonii TaxID=263511 RepID=Q4C1S7_CROWT|nr:DUF3727 domain-containing protein [Crocosphaera watsonii]EAM50122.1 hypothetical protein CwatDRAFT_2498 [Crocosphaera watsonii WH 8501]CCQ50054.1 FIG00558590: hypothetical protein [Crocosphaera watsonii WH 8502]
MSSFEYNQERDSEDIDRVTLSDEKGSTLDCYIENAVEGNDGTYLLLMPVDVPVVILSWDGEEEDSSDGYEISNAVLLEDPTEIEEIFADAKAVLAELDLTLKLTAFTVTLTGELPPIEDDGVLTLEVDSDEPSIDSEELQFLKDFYHNKHKYSIYTPLSPLLFLAKYNLLGKIELVSPEDKQMQVILEELLFDEMEE